MTTATATIRYRRTKAGEWVAYGPAGAIRAGTNVTVTKASGEVKRETVERVGKPFVVDGHRMVYGYLAARAARRSGRAGCITGGNCSSFGAGRTCGADDCDGY